MTVLRSPLHSPLRGAVYSPLTGPYGEEDQGGGDIPEWVPEGAIFHIDFMNDRAWSESGGEVAIDTLLGTDSALDTNWGTTAYNPASIAANGYQDENAAAYLGDLRDAFVAGSTFVITTHEASSVLSGRHNFTPLAVIPEVSGEAFQADIVQTGTRIQAENWELPVSVQSDAYNLLTIPGTNKYAFTATPTRFEAALNGTLVLTGNITGGWADTSGYTGALIYTDTSGNTATFWRSITVYDALPDTTGLAALSA